MNSKAIRFLLARLGENGYKAYIVGGAVRDVMQDILPQDIDILTNATIVQVEKIFSDQAVKVVGKTFQVCLVNGIEISSSRAASELLNFPESDLARRDFTINAMAYDPLEKKLIDPYDGKKDLEKRMIRFTREPEARIKEDPVRMIRACRFCAMIDGTFSIGSLDAILSCKGLLKASVAKERIRHEIMKAMALKQPSLFFRALRTTGLLAGIFPSLDRCYDLDGGPHHAETVFEHCLLVGDALPAKFPLMRLAGFLHDTGKFDAAEDTDGKQTFEGHETHVWATRKDLETLRFSAAEIAYILSLMQTHMRPLTEETTPKAARRLLAMLADHGLDYRAFMRMRIADKKGNLAKSPYTLTQIKVRLKKLIHEIQKETAFQKKDLQISGSDIMQILDMAPGPKIGEIKQQLFERVLDQPELNDYSELAMLCRSLNMKN